MPGLEQYLGVPVGKEAVTETLEFYTELRIVIDGTIEDHCKSQVSILHWLAGGLRKVHDLETPVTESEWSLAVKTATVWAARGHVVGDSLDHRQIGRLSIET
jgi:hypothetical protein